ncbi:radical SAM/SPASM domain-containing protein [Amycolatopsis taiwanensis]|uniref:radical SAM/SPASM domain-containing protein n=1 Tax=Amycolatopsis taiwanensis TaxID=342230 RepID=UPI001B80CD70|nr:radical SAM protein [Amycolatopsis taiwanensis]
MTTVERPPATTFLSLEITGKCQLECVHCCTDSGPSGTHGTMTTEDWKTVIDQAADLGVRTVQFIGGEPTLYPGLAELIDHAVARALGVEVFSNLVHVSDRMWAAFQQPGVTLATSYYSDDPEQHAAITRRPTHARTRENIETAVSLGIPIRAGVVDVNDGQRVEQAGAQLVSLGIHHLGYDRVRAIGRAAADGQGQADQLCGQCGDGKALIKPDGTVTPCTMARWVPVGNVQTNPLGEVLAAMPAVRQSLVEQGMPSGACSPTAGTHCGPQEDACSPQIRAANDCPPQGQNCWPHNRATYDCPPQGQDCWPHNR